MVSKTTIVGAISEVLRNASGPLSAREAYEAIVRDQLYSFRAVDPLNVVTAQIRRHTKELDFPSAGALKHFTIDADGRFAILADPIRVAPSLYRVQRPAGGGRTREAVVSVPTSDDDLPEEVGTGVSHTEIQYRLLDLGAQMGLEVWAPSVDRGKEWNSKRLRDVKNLLSRLPVHFNLPTMKTIENIDVLWIERGTIVAGFEIEHTTSIFSGLLRMSDLITMQPNIDIRFYLVAPDLRAAKFAREIIRPTFSSLRKPLHTLCRFLPYSALLDRLEQTRNVVRHLKPQFLDDIAETYDPNDEYDEVQDHTLRRSTSAAESKPNRRRAREPKPMRTRRRS